MPGVDLGEFSRACKVNENSHKSTKGICWIWLDEAPRNTAVYSLCTQSHPPAHQISMRDRNVTHKHADCLCLRVGHSRLICSSQFTDKVTD